MAVIDKTIDISGANNQVVQFWSTNTELQLLFVHIIVRGIDDPVKISFTQGNINNDIDKNTNLILGSDLLAPLEDCEGNLIEQEFTSDGNYVIASDTFFGKWGNCIVNKQLATVGTLRIITNTIKKV